MSGFTYRYCWTNVIAVLPCLLLPVFGCSNAVEANQKSRQAAKESSIRGDLKAWARHLEDAIHADPSDYTSKRDLGVLYIDHGRVDDGRKLLEEVVAKSNDKISVDVAKMILAKMAKDPDWVQKKKTNYNIKL